MPLRVITRPIPHTLLPIRNGLVAEYLFFEGSGTTLHDTSGNGRHGTISGAVWKQLPNGKWYLEFDGTDDYWSGPQPLAKIKTSFTIEVLCYIPATTKRIWILLLGGYDNYKGFFILYNAEGSWQPARTWQVGWWGYVQNRFTFKVADEWIHIVAVNDYENGIIRTYFNGDRVDEDSYDPSIIAEPSTWYFNCRAYGRYDELDADRPFQGKKALLRLWNRVFSDSEVKTLYQLAKLMVPDLG